jgi:glycosyltransferase involved in cell wall biosynthesis
MTSGASSPEFHSIVVPVYDEDVVLEQFLDRALAVLDRLPAGELIAVDDGSRDGSYELLAERARRDPRVKVVSLSRNFGHQLALTAGIDVASGDTVTVIDADLQDPPEVIPEMVDAWRHGADVVFAVRRSRAGDTAFKRSSAHAFYRLLGRLGDVDVPPDSGDFRLMSRRAADALRAMRERNRYMRGMVGWVGMKQAIVEYDRDARAAGQTKYPLRRMSKLALDGVMSFSTRPLRWAVWLGLFASAVGFCLALYAIVAHFAGLPLVPGWASLMVAILFMGGVQLVMLGVVGEYLGRVYDEVRQRPLYVVERTIGFEEADSESRPPS